MSMKRSLMLLGIAGVSVLALVLVKSSSGDDEAAAAAEYTTDPTGLVSAMTGIASSGPPGLEEARLGAIPPEPAEFVLRPRLPLCGAEAREGLSTRRDIPARRCLIRAWHRDLPAELISVSPSVEGPFLVIYRVIGNGTVEALSDDPFGQGPIRKICGDLEVSLKPTRSDDAFPLEPNGIRASHCERAETWGS